MADFLNTVLSVSVAAALSGFLAYRVADKWHRLAVGIIIVAVISSPIISFVTESENFDVSELVGDISPPDSDEYLSVAQGAFEEGVRRLVADREGIAPGSVYVAVTGFDPERMSADRIIITLVGEGLTVDYLSLEKYIRGLGLGECEVKYGMDKNAS